MGRKLGTSTLIAHAPTLGEIQRDLQHRLALIDAERTAIVAMLAELDGAPKRTRKGQPADAATSVTRPAKRFTRPPRG
jgi:hypothetical protein